MNKDRQDADGDYGIPCGVCGDPVPYGAHIVLSPISPNLHVMYCPTCWPCANRSRSATTADASVQPTVAIVSTTV